MKRQFTLFPPKPIIIVAFIAFAFFSQAKTYTVTVQNFKFTPDTVNALVGDTIIWSWISGSVTHTTTSLNVPTGAGTWDHTLNASSSTFTYIITSAGPYNYQCNIHPSLMQGVLMVSATTGIPVPEDEHKISVYPSSVQNEFTINWNNNGLYKNDVVIGVYDVSGKRKFQTSIQEVDMNKSTINVSDLAAGVYIVNIGSPAGSESFKIVKL
jgi:plastocyanin